MSEIVIFFHLTFEFFFNGQLLGKKTIETSAYKLDLENLLKEYFTTEYLDIAQVVRKVGSFQKMYGKITTIGVVLTITTERI